MGRVRVRRSHRKQTGHLEERVPDHDAVVGFVSDESEAAALRAAGVQNI